MFLLLYRHTDDGIFDNFRKISYHLPKIPKDSPKLCQTFTKKFTEDCCRLLRKTRICFNDTPTNLSLISETNLISVKSLISSLVRL